jgi:hypothetical protein
MLRANAYDTICHEHLEYYRLKQVKTMVDDAGLKIVDVQLNEVNGGSFAVTAAQQSSRYQPSADVQRLLAEETAMNLDEPRGYARFVSFVRNHKTELPALLHGLKKDGKKVLGYGASTKGNVLLQFCGITSDILPYIAEVNPDKFGCITPGTAIPIISEADAHRMRPDYLLVLPWHFRANTLQREKEFLTHGGKLIFPLPTIDIAAA